MRTEHESCIAELMLGAFDLHIHSAPDIRPRKVNDIELATAAKKVGLAGVLIKSHHTPSSARATIA